MKRILTIATLSIGVVALVALSWKIARPRIAAVRPEPISQDITSTLRAKGWKELRQLISEEGATPNFPQWERTWKAKCELGLGDSPCTDSSNVKVHLLSREMDKLFMINETNDKPLTSVKNGFAIAAQSDVHGGSPLNSKRQFASVLFNPKAKDSLVTAIPDLRGGKQPKFQAGSVIAKAIWTLTPMGDSGNKSLRSQAISRIRWQDQETWSGPEILPDPRSDSGGQFWDLYGIDLTSKPIVDCEPKNQILNPNNCLHAFLLDMPDPTQRQDASVAGTNDATKTAVKNDCPGTGQCLVSLVAIHFMVKLEPTDSLRKSGDSDWLFMTFWWTGKDNGSGLPAPWKYFQMNVTQSVREDIADGLVKNICFSPYLEGLESNGAVSNCASCHQYAAYDPHQPNSPDISDPTGDCMGKKPMKQSPADIAKCKDVESAYRSGGRIPTDRVWSLRSLVPPSSN